MKVLVTGASGFIGQALVTELLRQNVQVSVLTRAGKNLEQQSWYSQVTVFEADLCTPDTLHDCCQNQQTIIHCAGYAHNTGQTNLHQAVNFQGTVNLLQSAIAARVKRFIHISSSKAINPGQSAYGLAKQQAEQRVLRAHAASRIEGCCLRPVAVYGPGMKGNLMAWMRLIQKGLAPPVPPVRARIALVGLHDLCRAIILACEHEKVAGKCYVLADGIPYHPREIENSIRKHLGLRPHRLYLPRCGFYLAGLLGEKSKSWLGLNAGFNLNSYNALFGDEFHESTEFTRDTGFRFRQNFYDQLPTLMTENK